MTLLQRLALPILVLIVDVAYWVLTYEPAGTVLLFLFAIALGVMMTVLGPTLNDVGPTAPVDPDWHERQVCEHRRPCREPDAAAAWRQEPANAVSAQGTNGRWAAALALT